MQRVKHNSGYRNIHWLLDEIEQMYADTSEPKVGDVGLFSPTYDASLEAIWKTFLDNSFYDFPVREFVHKEVKPLSLPDFDPKNIIVCYSGGKDSLSVVRYYQQLGYHVYAYHIRGLNKTYYDEWKIAEEASKALGFELYIDSVQLSGNHVWVEHPMKNMIMMNMALSWGVQNGITTQVATGNFTTSFLSDNAFEVCAGDCREFWQMYEDVINRIIPDFRVQLVNENYQTAYKLLLEEPQNLKYTISCVTPNRFRRLFRERTMKNYPVDLLPNRCGCCWKCAAEYVWFCDNGVFPFNADYYIHCIEVLLNTLEQETGHLIHNLEYVWSTYFFHPMSQSKAYEELSHAIIRARKIEIAD